jgi:hypothetical protein
MLFGEHVGEDDFRVLDATVEGIGGFASFLRGLAHGLSRLESFFRRTRRDYRRFNYLGEWHSHPSFALRPSATDDATMLEIVNDAATGARFAVGLIVKLEDDLLRGAAVAYYPDGEREPCRTVFEDTTPMAPRSQVSHSGS